MKAQVISFHCVLKTKLGRVISSTTAHDVVTLPGEGEPQILAGLAEGLQGLKGGEKRLISLSADRAYGFYDPAKVIVTSMDALGEQSVIVGETATVLYRGKPTVFRVTEVRGDEVTLDANHPLAGEDLVFEIEAMNVREAGPDDLETSAPGPLFH